MLALGPHLIAERIIHVVWLFLFIFEPVQYNLSDCLGEKRSSYQERDKFIKSYKVDDKFLNQVVPVRTHAWIDFLCGE